MKRLLCLTVLAVGLYVAAVPQTAAQAQLVIGRGGVQYYGRGQGYYGGYGGYGGGYGYGVRQYQGYGNGGYYNGYNNGGYYGRPYVHVYRPYGYGGYNGYGNGW